MYNEYMSLTKKDLESIRGIVIEGLTVITEPQLEKVNNRLDKVESRLDGVESQLNLVCTKLNKVEDDLSEVKLRQAVNDKKLDAVIDEFKDQENRISKIEHAHRHTDL